MSDLAPFVAAALRDKVVADLKEELEELRKSLEEERAMAQKVAITGPRGTPIYATARFSDGDHDHSPELWKVDFSSSSEEAQCTVKDLGGMEVRIGGICKARLSNGIVEAFVNDVTNNYDHANKSGKVSVWFGGSSGIWLNVCLRPIEQQQYAALRDFDLGGGETLLETLLATVGPDATVAYTEAAFLIDYVNEAMGRWKMLPPEDDEDEEEEAGTEATTRGTDRVVL